MSTEQRPQPRLIGFRGPFYPAELSKLQERYQYSLESVTPQVLGKVARALGSVHEPAIENGRTADGRYWPYRYCFPIGTEGRLAILFPPIDDLKPLTFRRIAVYTKGVTRSERSIFLTRYLLRMDGALRDAAESVPTNESHDPRSSLRGRIIAAVLVLLFLLAMVYFADHGFSQFVHFLRRS